MTSSLLRSTVVLALLLSASMSFPRAQGGIRIILGSVVPKGSLWDESLHYLKQEWRRISGSAIEVRVQSGGVHGDETELVRKIRQGTIQAAGLSSVGLSRIDSSISCLQIPMMFRSYAELDYVRDRVAPAIEARIEAKGFKVLSWADGGWVHTFTKKPARTPNDVRRLRLFTSAGDPDTERLFKELGFQAVPLSMADMIVALQTGLIDAFSTVPLFAQLEESYKMAPNMIDVMWLPMIGATVIGKDAWEQVPTTFRQAMFDAARASSDRLRVEIRKMGDDAVPEMRKRGLNVISLDAEAQGAWQSAAETAYPQLRGRYCPADLFDQVRSLRDAFRASAKGH